LALLLGLLLSTAAGPVRAAIGIDPGSLTSICTVGNASTLTIANVTVSAANDRVLIAAAGSEASTVACNFDTGATGATFGATNMTLAVAGVVGGGVAFACQGIFYLLDAGIDSECASTYPCTRDVVITLDGTVNERHGGAYVLTNVDQAPPEAVNSVGYEPAVDPVNISMTNLTDGAWVVDIHTANVIGDAVTTQAGQVERFDQSCNSSSSQGSTQVATAGVATLGWDHSSAFLLRNIQSLAAFAPKPITLEETVTGGHPTTSPVTLPTIQGGVDQNYVLFIGTRSNQDVTAVTGGGLTWVEPKEQCAGNSATGIRVWTAFGSPAGPFQAQISYVQGLPLTAALLRYSGARAFEDPTGENTNGENGVCSGGPKTTTAQLTLTSTNAGSVHLLGVAPHRRTVTSFSAGYSEDAVHVEGAGGNATRVAVYSRPFASAATDPFQATIDKSEDWATAGLVLNVPCAGQDCSLLSDQCNVGVCNTVTDLCEAQPTNEGGSCEDGDACTTADSCQVGACVGGAPPNCDDGSVCTSDSCDSVAGCVNTPVTDGTSCNDGDACTTGDACISGLCTGGAPPNCDDSNECTSDSCDSVAGCQNVPVTDGTSCDDASLCTLGDTCQTGICTGGAPPNCDDGEFCTADSCVPATGCQNTPLANGTACDDGDACTTVDQCSLGVCVGGGAPLDCDDGSVCTADGCDPVLGCQNVPVPNGTPCADADLCNGNETCQTGICSAGTPLNCDDGNTCTADSCDALLGCQNPPVADGTACADADLCNGDETCQSGTCTPGAPLSCDDGESCTADSCDALLGCQNAPVADGTACNDGDACTTIDECTAGVCVGGGSPFDCDDLDPCTADSCDPVLGCQNVVLPDGTPCVDGNLCNGDETCQLGVCTAGTPPDCDDLEVCTTDSCDPVLGCQNTAVLDGTACGDGDLCNGDETCQLGVCSNGTPLNCDDGELCTVDGCDAVLGCQNIPLADGSPCADGDLCNGDETCQTGTCTAGTPPNCDDGNICTGDSCDPALGCQNTPVTDGTSCADGDLCNGAETCQAGSCLPGSPLTCNDGDVCTTDSCDAVLGCQTAPAPDGTPCNDGDVCSTLDQCAAGICGGGSPLDCDDGNPCTADSCDSVLGCLNTPVGDGISCSDGDVCNGAETCQAGTCSSGTPLNCIDGNACTADSCDPVLGCQNPPVTDGTACPDGDLCNGDETCQAGACTAALPPDCDDGNPCTANGCHAVLGCQNPPVGDGAACVDGDLCNGAETCQSGICTPGTPLSCDDGNACTADACDAVLGCLNTPIPDGTGCDDGDACTTADACTSGICLGGAPPNCDDGNTCTADSCDPVLGCQSVAVADGASCDDGNACTTADSCVSGACSGGPPPDCDDGNTCTADSCDPVLGCQSVAVPDGISCDDGDPCTTVDQCSAGICVGGGSPFDCDDGNPCTADSCDPILGCENLPVSDGTSCDDGQFCTTADICTGGICSGGPTDCSGVGDQCNAGVCNETTDACEPQPANEGGSCEDGDLCNGAETCQSGTCTAGTPPNCDDGNICTADSCDPALGCQNTPVADGISCSDGDVCNGAETCQSGACSPGTPLNCDDGNACTSDSCNALLGCQNDPLADGASCSDGDACNGAETCQAGSCSAGTPPNCDDGNPCTADSCDPVLGCENPPVTDGTACADADLCNGDETCQAGVCSSGTPPDCNDGNVCTVDSCNASLGCQNSPALDGSACDDGDACTTGDACISGFCLGGAAPNCDDGNPCTGDSCVSALGCQNIALADGTLCQDGDLCTDGDSCQVGICTAHGRQLQLGQRLRELAAPGRDAVRRRRPLHHDRRVLSRCVCWGGLPVRLRRREPLYGRPLRSDPRLHQCARGGWHLV
jgi:hypothetical protein